MSPIIAKQRVINPTEDQCSTDLIALMESNTFLSHNKSLPTTDDQHIVLTHPIFKFVKPERTSKKTKRTKKSEVFYVVYDPESLGKGAFGSVHRVLGVWKKINKQYVFRSKKDKNKQRVTKTNQGFIFNHSNEEIFIKYKKEFVISNKLPSLGFKYEPITSSNATFQLLYEQPGTPLNELLKKIKIDPSYLSVTEKLKLTINLLEALDLQVHGVPVYDDENKLITYVIHRDIKPENIIVKEDLSVRVIDFGLATLQSQAVNLDSLAGSHYFMDPKLLTGFVNRSPREMIVSKQSDYFSLACVITELWGDFSRYQADTLKDLLNHYMHWGVDESAIGKCPGLNEEEKRIIPDIVKSMSGFDGRLSKDVALSSFKALLEKRVNAYNIICKNLAEEKPIDELSKSDLITVFKSAYGATLIERMKRSPSHFSKIKQHLSQDLGILDENTLDTLHQQGMDFSSYTLSDQLLSSNCTAEKIRKLINLGVPCTASNLVSWIKRFQSDLDEYHWASICRVLYNAIPDAEEYIASIPVEDTFISTFMHKFLKGTSDQPNDKTNIRLIRRHLDVINDHKLSVQIIKDNLADNLQNTAFEAALCSSELMCTDAKYILLDTLPHFASINEAVKQLNKIIIRIQEIESLPNMPHREQLVRRLKNDLEQRKALKGYTLDRALFDLGDFISILDRIDELDFLVSSIKSYKKIPSFYNPIINELDRSYEKDDISRGDLMTDYTFKNKIDSLYFILESIDTSRSKLKKILPANSYLGVEYADFLKQDRIKRYDDFFDEAESFKCTYENILDLMHQFELGASQEFVEDQNRSAMYCKIFSTVQPMLLKSNKATIDEMIEAYNKFNEQEFNFYNHFNEYPLSQNLLYRLIHTNIDCRPISSCTHLLYKMNALQEFTIEFMEVLEALLSIDSDTARLIPYLQNINGLQESFATTTSAADLIEDLRLYLTEPIEVTNQHLRLVQQKVLQNIQPHFPSIPSPRFFASPQPQNYNTTTLPHSFNC